MKYEAPDNRKCLRVTRLISEAQDQDDALTLAERLRVRLHLLLCADCRHFKHNTEALHQIMKRYADINEDGQATGSEGAPQDAGDAPTPRKPAP
ncbi:MAG: zf-HC2 domain-containing protein [Lautropia mirabilis]|nr:zf-HC2 domain-containing protein [Lautropia mirabilis]